MTEHMSDSVGPVPTSTHQCHTKGFESWDGLNEKSASTGDE